MVDLVFVHIPKTAGTSATASIWQMVGDSGILRIHDEKRAHSITADKFPEWDVDPDVRFIAGHLTVAQLLSHPHFRDLHQRRKYIFSVLRDPVERALSLFNYNFARQIEPDQLEQRFMQMARGYPENRQHEYLSSPNVDAFELAKTQYIYTLENLQKGLYETVGEVFPEFDLQKLALDRKNATDYTNNPSVLRREMVPEEAIELIRNRSQKDYELYKFVRDRELAVEQA